MGPERLVKKCSKMAGWKAEDHENGLGQSSTHTSSTKGTHISLLLLVEFFICQVTNNVASTSYCIVAIYYDHVILYI